MNRDEERRGLLPSADFQASFTLAHATMAKRRAEKLAEGGVSPTLAADRAFLSTSAVLAWLFGVAPVMGWCYLATLLTLVTAPFGVVIWAPGALLCTVLSVRVMNFHNAPADRKLVYRIPTFVIVGLYVAWLGFAFLLTLIGFLLGYS